MLCLGISFLVFLLLDSYIQLLFISWLLFVRLFLLPKIAYWDLVGINQAECCKQLYTLNQDLSFLILFLLGLYLQELQSMNIVPRLQLAEAWVVRGQTPYIKPISSFDEKRQKQNRLLHGLCWSLFQAYWFSKWLSTSWFCSCLQLCPTSLSSLF
jgi:hypothetical protein